MSQMAPEGFAWHQEGYGDRVIVPTGRVDDSLDISTDPYRGIPDRELRLLADQLFDDGKFEEHSLIEIELKRRSDNAVNAS